MSSPEEKKINISSNEEKIIYGLSKKFNEHLDKIEPKKKNLI